MDKYDVLMNLKRQATGSTLASTTALPTTTIPTTAPPTTTPDPTTTLNAPPSTASPTASTPTLTLSTAVPTTSTPPGTNTGTAPPTRSTAQPSATSAEQSPTQPPTSSPAPTSSAPPTSRTTPPSSAPPTSSAAPPSTTTPQTSSTPPPTSSSTPPTSTPVSTSTSTPVTSSTPATSSAATTPTITPSSTQLVTPTVIPIGTNSRTTLSVPLTPTLIRTTSGGVVYTVTAIVGNPSGSPTAAAAKKPFFQQTGAVVGVFVVVGVAATALAVFIITLFLRRRRAKAFDREVQDAAREAALAQAPVDDDDYGAGGSYNTHASKPMSTEGRSGYGYGGSNASSWDPYGRGAGATAGGYEMHQRRTSTGTAPGMAGFAAGETFARNVGIDQPPQGYNNQPQGYGPAYGQQQAYNNQGYSQQQGYNNNQQQQQQAYNNTSPPQTYQLAQERGPARAPPQPKMMMPEAQAQQRQNYNTVDAYRPGPSYGQAHPGEQVEYGHAYGGEENDLPRPSEDLYGGYEYGNTSNNHAGGSSTSNPPAYAPGPSGNAGATGDRKGGAGAAIGAAMLTREPSGKSAATRYSQDDSDGSVDERQERRVLKVANE